MRLLLRGTFIASCVFGLLVLTALILGLALQTHAITTYQDFNGYRSTTQVIDDQRHLQLDLAGTRCFKPLPEWVWADIELLGDYNWEGSAYQSQITPITIQDHDLSLALERLNCSRIEAGKPLGLPDFPEPPAGMSTIYSASWRPAIVPGPSPAPANYKSCNDHLNQLASLHFGRGHPSCWVVSSIYHNLTAG